MTSPVGPSNPYSPRTQDNLVRLEKHIEDYMQDLEKEFTEMYPQEEVNDGLDSDKEPSK